MNKLNQQYVNLIEVALLTSDEYLGEVALKQLFRPALSDAIFQEIMDYLKERWQERGIALIEQQGQWRFIVKAEYFDIIPHLREGKNPKYSNAVWETLAIIAYQQPITRSEIEAIRGVSVSTATMQILTARQWIEIVGYKEAIGKPAFWGSTAQFLLDFNLVSLEDLPPLEELKKLLQH